MKLFLTIICAISVALVAANAQTSSTTTTSSSAQGTEATTTTTTTENMGTITEFTPGASLVLSSGSGEAVHYKLAKNVTYINGKGKEIKAERIRKDRKVRVHYTKEGNDMVVDKVTIVKKD